MTNNNSCTTPAPSGTTTTAVSLAAILSLFFVGLPQSSVAATIDAATVVRCTLSARRDMSHIGMDRNLMAPDDLENRFQSWMMQETRIQPRSPITLYWLPKNGDNPPVLRVQSNGQDRTKAKLVSRTKHNLTAVVELSDRSISRAWLVSVNFRRELVVASEIQSSIGGMRSSIFGFNCLFDTSTEIVPGLLGERFRHLDDDQKSVSKDNRREK